MVRGCRKGPLAMSHQLKGRLAPAAEVDVGTDLLHSAAGICVCCARHACLEAVAVRAVADSTHQGSGRRLGLTHFFQPAGEPRAQRFHGGTREEEPLLQNDTLIAKPERFLFPLDTFRQQLDIEFFGQTDDGS